MTMAEPSPSSSGGGSFGSAVAKTRTRWWKNSAAAVPSAATCRLGRSPASGISLRSPCRWPWGLMCPLAAEKSGEQAPTLCRWMPFGPGGKALTRTCTMTPDGACSNTASPMFSPSTLTMAARAVAAVVADAASDAGSALTKRPAKAPARMAGTAGRAGMRWFIINAPWFGAVRQLYHFERLSRHLAPDLPPACRWLSRRARVLSAPPRQ